MNDKSGSLPGATDRKGATDLADLQGRLRRVLANRAKDPDDLADLAWARRLVARLPKDFRLVEPDDD
jgi:hypothetical protein